MKSALSAARGRALNHAGLGLSNACARKATQLRRSSRPVLAAGLPSFHFVYADGQRPETERSRLPPEP